MKNHFSAFLVVLMSLCFLNACSFINSHNEGKITLKLPEKKAGFTSRALKSKLSKDVKGLSLGSQWGLANQSTIGESDCYAVYLQATDLESGSCTSADGAFILPISKLYGLYAAGSSVDIDVPVGSNRTLGVFSFMSADGKCANALDANFNSQKYSQPLLVGTKTTSIVSGLNDVLIEVSMKNAIPIESCSGKTFASLAGSSWPSCNFNVSNVAYSNGVLNISGQCLGNTDKVVLLNTNTAEKIDLSIVNKSQQALDLKPSQASAGLLAKTLYKVLISNANGQTTEVPFSLSLDNVVSFPILKSSSGATIGDILPVAAGMNGSGNYYAVLNSSGELLNYYSLDGYFSTSKLYLVPNLMPIAPSLGGTAYKQLAQSGILPYMVAWIGFSGANCTGDVVVYTNSTNVQVRGNIIVQPKGCTSTTDAQGQQVWNCTGWDYFRLNGAPTVQSNVSIASSVYMGWGSMASTGTFSYCSNSPSTMSFGAVFHSSQKVPFGGGDPATVVQDAVIVGR